jgi:hypothetical protein
VDTAKDQKNFQKGANNPEPGQAERNLEWETGRSLESRASKKVLGHAPIERF